MAKHYINKDDIMIGTEVEWDFTCGEVVDYLRTGVRLYYIIHPFDRSSSELMIVSEDDVKPYVWMRN